MKPNRRTIVLSLALLAVICFMVIGLVWDQRRTIMGYRILEYYYANGVNFHARMKQGELVVESVGWTRRYPLKEIQPELLIRFDGVLDIRASSPESLASFLDGTIGDSDGYRVVDLKIPPNANWRTWLHAEYEDDRLVHMWLDHKELSECPIEFSLNGSEFLSLPFSVEEMKRFFGKPESTDRTELW